MSSSNLVRLAFIPETTYGVTPGSGNFSSARFTSEKLSGSPTTTSSQQIRTDRMSSGQIVTALAVGGDVPFELAKEAALESFMESAMYSAWTTKTTVTVALTYVESGNTLTRASGSYIADGIVVGDFIKLALFVNAGNNVYVQVAAVTSATVLRIIVPAGMVDEVGTSTTFKRADKLVIGTTKKSFTVEKAFLDVPDHAIIYKGMIVSGMEINVAFGELVTGTFTFAGNGYSTVDDISDFITDGRTIDPAATTDTMNGSIDMPFLATAAGGTFDSTNLEIESVNIKLNNNLNPQNVIGNIAPRDYSAGTAQIDIGLNMYLTAAAWDLLSNKLQQTPFAIGFILQHAGVGYGFYMPAVQVSFDDPSSGGQNQDINLETKGVAKVGPTGESALSLYRIA